MTAPEFSRCFALNTIGTAPRSVSIDADDAERAALAQRFDLAGLDQLRATATLVTQGEAIAATGSLTASVIQRCVATGVPLPASINSDFNIQFVARGDAAVADEIEISADECDIVEHDSAAIDLGEAVAQTLLLTLNPFPRAPGAAKALKAAGVIGEDEVVNGAFAALKDLL
jgi:uncharacterized metal-binding protein YceD (DUF177 family)